MWGAVSRYCNDVSRSVVVTSVTCINGIDVRRPNIYWPFSVLQVLDDVTSVYQLNFGKFLCLFCVTVSHLSWRRELPGFIQKANMIYMVLFTCSTLLDTLFGFQAVTHIAVGTGYAVESVCFLAIVVVFRLLSGVCNKIHLQPLIIAIDLSTVLLISLGVLFVVQPDAIFHGIKYFNKGNEVYSKMKHECHIN